MCLKIYQLDPAKFLSAPGLAWQVAALKKIEIKLELSTDIDILLMVEKGIRGEICNEIHRYAKANNKYMNDYDKNKESSYLKYCDVNNLYGWVMLQKLPVNKFKWIEEKNIKNYNEERDERCFLEVDVQYPKKLHELHNNLPFLPEKKEIEENRKACY